MKESVLNDILKLSPAEQLEIAELIYSSLALPKQLSANDQLDEAKRRSEQVRLEPKSTLSSQEMWNEVGDLRMLEKIRFQKDVPRDLDEISNAYELIKADGANNVRSEIQKTLELISTFPEMYPVLGNEIRLVKTKKCQLLIRYTIVDGIRVVLSIYHSDLGEIKRTPGDA